MAITRQNIQAEAFFPNFDATGNLIDLAARVSYTLVDDSDGEIVGHARNHNLWALMTPTQRDQANTVFQRLNQLATT